MTSLLSPALPRRIAKPDVAYLERAEAGSADLGIADVVGDMRRPLHMMMLGAGVLLVENLVQLDRVPLDRPFLFVGLPLRIQGGTGSPIRAVAILDVEV